MKTAEALHLAVNAAVGELYREGVLAANTWLIYKHARQDSNWPSYANYTDLQRYARKHWPRYLRTGGKRLWLTYKAGRWSWAAVGKST